MPIVAWGSGTSLEGHTLPERGGISLNLSRMKKIIKLHAEDMDVVVEPGLTYNELNDILKPHGTCHINIIIINTIANNVS